MHAASMPTTPGVHALSESLTLEALEQVMVLMGPPEPVRQMIAQACDLAYVQWSMLIENGEMMPLSWLRPSRHVERGFMYRTEAQRGHPPRILPAVHLYGPRKTG